MTVRVERSGPVTTVVLDRPEVRNAVDGATAQALAEAFRAFDADPDQAVAVLYGAGGTFCAGADLKAVGTDTGNRVVPPGTARAQAEALAASLVGFPQACLRNDRLSILEQEGHTEREALLGEYHHGVRSLAEGALDGAARFAAGEGRHGAFGG